MKYQLKTYYSLHLLSHWRLMLFSIFISYYLVEHGRKTHVLLTTLFIVLASLLSTFFVYAWRLSFFLYPPRFLSFPFSSAVGVHRWWGVTTYDIYFFTLKVVSISPQNAPLYGFMFFLLVNITGATLGYWIGKRLLRESLERNLFDFFSKSGVLSFIVCFFIFWITRARAPLISYLIYSFCVYFFWIPAGIATAFYGIYKWLRIKNKSNVISSWLSNKMK